jgi:cell wall-associated NlpC family hydrolase
VRLNWLAKAAVATAAISVPVTALAGTAHAAPQSGQAAAVAAAAATIKAPSLFDHPAAAVARTLVGDPYAYGGTTPAGFDCSGLTRYVYARTGHGKTIPRTSESQFLAFRPIPESDAQPGDLVFFHETSNPSSYVYHVGIFEGGDNMVAATTSSGGVELQSYTWGGDTVTFGSITH